MFDGEQAAGAGESESKAAAESTHTESQEAPKAPDQHLGESGIAALNKEREAREAAEKELKKLQRAQTERDEAAAKERGDFEKLATERAKRIEDLERDIAERERRDLRAKVARTHKLPEDLAALLQGDDEAALVESAKLLAKHIKPQAAPDTEAGAGSETSSKATDRPVVKTRDEKQPAYTYDGRPKVAWPSRT